jgi:hypothetical protein
MTAEPNKAAVERRLWWDAICIAIARRYRPDLSPYHPLNTAVRLAWRAADSLSKESAP